MDKYFKVKFNLQEQSVVRQNGTECSTNELTESSIHIRQSPTTARSRKAKKLIAPANSTLFVIMVGQEDGPKKDGTDAPNRGIEPRAPAFLLERQKSDNFVSLGTWGRRVT